MSTEQIALLNSYRYNERLTLPALRTAMAAPFRWETLKRALQGLPVWDLSHAYITQWIDRYLPAVKLTPDQETAETEEKAGSEEPSETHKAEDAEEKKGTTRTFRGSR